MNGILLAFQFFTTFPIKKELPLGRKEVTQMYIALPFVGATIGLIMYGVMEVFQHSLGFSSLFTAVCIVLTGIILTGGIHMDGWADTGDAFFSYKDRNRRLEILDDPRLGAFGTLSIVLLIIFKIALFYELLIRQEASLILFIMIPFLARASMSIYFTITPTGKEKGLASFFKDKMAGRKILISSIVGSLFMLIVLFIYTANFLAGLILLVVIGSLIIWFRNWSLKHFGGVTGDLCGAFIEGGEVIFWLVVLVLL